MKWEIKRKITAKKSSSRRKEILTTLLKNRRIIDEKKRQEYLHPKKPEKISLKEVGIIKQEFQKALKIIQYSRKNKKLIIIYGDYDADGICATAIVWEFLNAQKANVLPFIPHRDKHGYGLSIKGIQEIVKEQGQKPFLIITVDNGIVAHEAIKYCVKNKIKVIVSDHHQPAKKLPKANAIIHTTKLAGAGVAWIFVKELAKSFKGTYNLTSSLDLAIVGTIADMVPLTNANRSLVKYGIQYLQKTERIGLLEMFEEANINLHEIETYHVSYIIGPRLNAMGRLEHGIESLRLLCTRNKSRAKVLAKKLGNVNRRRQELTDEMVENAKNIYLSQFERQKKEKIIIIEHQEFHEGVIGLIAGKLVEEFYKPTVVIAKGEKTSKASARSISGFSIIEAIRKHEDYLIDVGGHPMAAGFTIETNKIGSFTKSLKKYVSKDLNEKLLTKKIEVDCEIKLKDINWNLYEEINKLEPFGVGNNKPIFVLKNVQVLEAMKIGKNKNHLKILLSSMIKSQPTIPVLWFGRGEAVEQLSTQVSLAFSIDENVWRDKKELQLKIIDISN